MARSVQLHDEASLVAVEVDHERPDRALTTPFHLEPLRAQSAEEDAFRERRMTTKLSSQAYTHKTTIDLVPPGVSPSLRSVRCSRDGVLSSVLPPSLPPPAGEVIKSRS